MQTVFLSKFVTFCFPLILSGFGATHSNADSERGGIFYGMNNCNNKDMLCLPVCK